MTSPRTSFPSATGALISLLRPVNTAVSFIGIAAACIIAGARSEDWRLILLAASAGALVTAAGNIINDVYDIAIDRINKPRRALASGRLRPATASLWAALCGLCALTCAIPLGSGPLLIVGVSLVCIYLYSARLKRVVLVGNIVVGLLTGIAFIFGALVFDNPAAGLVPAGFAFLFNLAREVLKDVEDMRGDRADNAMTFPLRAGESAALRFVTFLLLTLVTATFLPLPFDLYGPLYIWVVVFGVDIVLIYVLISMWNDRSTGNIARLNVLLKFDMLAGIAAILLGSITL
jgi:geranylgeranylglycerol-phosphate geranylgeranyltransferase